MTRKYMVAADVGGTCTDTIVFAAGEPAHAMKKRISADGEAGRRRQGLAEISSTPFRWSIASAAEPESLFAENGKICCASCTYAPAPSKTNWTTSSL